MATRVAQTALEHSDEVIQTIHGETSRMPPGRSMLFVVQMGGAVARVAEDATAFGGRSAPFQTLSLGIWDDPEQKASAVTWVRGLSSALEAHGRGAYVNLTDHQDESALRVTYGTAKYARLQGIKAKYDPENVFRLNQNITPGRHGQSA